MEQISITDVSPDITFTVIKINYAVTSVKKVCLPFTANASMWLIKNYVGICDYRKHVNRIEACEN